MIATSRVGRWSVTSLIVLWGSASAWAGPIAPSRVVNLGTNASLNDLAVLPDGTMVAVGAAGNLLKLPSVWAVAPDDSTTRRILTDGLKIRTGTATRVSTNGDFVGGYVNVRTTPGNSRHQGLVWTRSQPASPDEIPALPGGTGWTSGYGVSDNREIVGEAEGFGAPIRWDGFSSTLRLPGPGGAAVEGGALDVSADGEVAVGQIFIADYEQAVRWTDSGVTILDSRQSYAFGVSSSGQYTAGMVNTNTFGLFSFSPAYWDGTDLHLLSLDGNGNTFLGAAIWATDSGIVGGTTAQPGEAGAAGWLAFPDQSPVLFNEWWQSTTGSPFPIDVTSVNSAVERGGILHFALSGGYLASVNLAAAAAVPEPASSILALLGGIGVGVAIWRRRQVR